MSAATLDAKLLAAHASGNTEQLADLYEAAGSEAEAEGNIDQACFYLTHAYVFALQIGSPNAASLKAKLALHGREEA